MLPGTVRRLAGGVKHPQMQWNILDRSDRSRGLLEGVPTPAWVYFVHSYAPEVTATPSPPATTADRWRRAAERGPVWGTQFHPEKSGCGGPRDPGQLRHRREPTRRADGPLPGHRHPRRGSRAPGPRRLRPPNRVRRSGGAGPPLRPAGARGSMWSTSMPPGAGSPVNRATVLAIAGTVGVPVEIRRGASAPRRTMSGSCRRRGEPGWSSGRRRWSDPGLARTPGGGPTPGGWARSRLPDRARRSGRGCRPGMGAGSGASRGRAARGGGSARAGGGDRDRRSSVTACSADPTRGPGRRAGSTGVVLSGDRLGGRGLGGGHRGAGPARGQRGAEGRPRRDDARRLSGAISGRALWTGDMTSRRGWRRAHGTGDPLSRRRRRPVVKGVRSPTSSTPAIPSSWPRATTPRARANSSSSTSPRRRTTADHGRGGVADRRAVFIPFTVGGGDPVRSRTPGCCCGPGRTRSGSIPPPSTDPSWSPSWPTSSGASAWWWPSTPAPAPGGGRAPRGRSHPRRPHPDRHRCGRVGRRWLGPRARVGPAHLDGPGRHPGRLRPRADPDGRRRLPGPGHRLRAGWARSTISSTGRSRVGRRGAGRLDLPSRASSPWPRRRSAWRPQGSRCGRRDGPPPTARSVGAAERRRGAAVACPCGHHDAGGPTTGDGGDPKLAITVLADRGPGAGRPGRGRAPLQVRDPDPGHGPGLPPPDLGRGRRRGPHVRSVKVGDTVLFNPEDRFEVEVQGDEYVILRERDIHAVAATRIDGGTGLYL